MPRLGLVCLTLLSLIGSAIGDDQWVTLKGRVAYDGEPPAMAELNITADQAHCLEKGKLLNETWIVNKSNKGVKNAFVWLASDTATSSGKDLPVHPSLKEIAKPQVEITQPRCGFVPHALGIREGQNVVVKNDSPVTHNVRWEGSPIKNPAGNVTIVSGKETTISKLKADRFPVTVSCSIHPWMKGYVRVFDHPYYAVTDENGNFEIKLAPVGKYRLFVWHEGCGWKGGAAGRSGDEITIKAGDTQDLGNLLIKQ
jgi:plastocyanin